MNGKNKIKKIFVITLVISTITPAITVAGQGNIHIGLRKLNLEKETDKNINQLIIDAPSSVYEGESFVVVVTADDMPIRDALVVFLNEKYYTGPNGSAKFIAPMVEHTCNYSITASKTGYLDGITWICVMNDERLQLVIHAPASVKEGEEFEVAVTAGNESVDDVCVIFRNRSYITNMGIVYITAPQVDQDTTETIFAFKEGYLSDQKPITIKDSKTLYITNRADNPKYS